MDTLKLRGRNPLHALDVDVEPASDQSYIDVAVSNKFGRVAVVSLALNMDGQLIVHAEDHTERSEPGADDARCVVEKEVLVTEASQAKPIDWDGSPAEGERGRLDDHQLRQVVNGFAETCPECSGGFLTTETPDLGRIVTCPFCPFWQDAAHITKEEE